MVQLVDVGAKVQKPSMTNVKMVSLCMFPVMNTITDFKSLSIATSQVGEAFYNKSLGILKVAFNASVGES